VADREMPEYEINDRNWSRDPEFFRVIGRDILAITRGEHKQIGMDYKGVLPGDDDGTSGNFAEMPDVPPSDEGEVELSIPVKLGRTVLAGAAY
jgi:hypothetical protein